MNSTQNNAASDVTALQKLQDTNTGVAPLEEDLSSTEIIPQNTALQGFVDEIDNGTNALSIYNLAHTKDKLLGIVSSKKGK